MTHDTITTNHDLFYDGSPFYRAVFDRHGAYLHSATAERIARDHCTTVAALIYDEGMPVTDTTSPVTGQPIRLVATLDLIQSLGY